MIQALRNRQPGAPLWRVLWWHLLHFGCFVLFVPLYKYRAWGVRRIPATGPLLIVSNHQSYYDPILVGLGAHRRQFYALANAELFKVPGLSSLIRSLNAIPLERGTGDTRAMRRGVDTLKDGQALLIFPEGGRTPDGQTLRFEPGTALILRRAKPTVLPVAIEGAFETYPRMAKRPRITGRIGVMYGEPIAAETLLAQGAEAGLEDLRQRVAAMQAELRERLDRQAPAAALRPEAESLE